MSGIYSGAQACFRKKNFLAEWILCAVHSLNMVAFVAAKCCTEIVNFFSILQSVKYFYQDQHSSFMLKTLKNKVNVFHSV